MSSAVYRQHFNRTVVERNRPLDIARAAIDEVYYEIRSDVQQQLREGVALSDLMQHDYQHPLEAQASHVLGEGPTGRMQDWTDWFHLQATMAAAKRQRIFMLPAFGSQDYERERTQLQQEAYKSYGQLVCDTLDMFGKVRTLDERRDVTGALSEFTVLAGLNLVMPGQAGAQLSNTNADRRQKIDAGFRYFMPGETHSSKANLQIKTSSFGADKHRQQVSAKDSDKKQPHVVVVVARDQLGTQRDRRRAAHLIARDLQGVLGEDGKAELVWWFEKLTDYVIKQSRVPSTPAVAAK